MILLKKLLAEEKKAFDSSAVDVCWVTYMASVQHAGLSKNTKLRVR